MERSPAMVLLFAIATWSGCTRVPLDLFYNPTAKAKGPLSTIGPLNFALRVEDHRDPRERHRLGAYQYDLVSAKNVDLVLFDALTSELENSGHGVTDKSKAQIVINVDLKRYWSVKREAENLGTLSANVTLIKHPGDIVIFSKRIVGTFRETREFGITFGSDQPFEKVLNGALAEFVRQFSYDPQVVRALQLAQTGSTDLTP